MIDQRTSGSEPQLPNEAPSPALIAAQPLQAKYPATSSLESVAALVRHRRRLKMLRFAVFEVLALGIMVASALAGVSARFAAESLTPLFRVLPISAAIVAVILPIFFFGDPKRRNRRRP